jgi:hypothetical protein
VGRAGQAKVRTAVALIVGVAAAYLVLLAFSLWAVYIVAAALTMLVLVMLLGFPAVIGKTVYDVVKKR